MCSWTASRILNDTNTMQVVAGQELSGELSTRLNTIEQQMLTRHMLQRSLVSPSLDEVREVMSDTAKAALDNEEAWLLPEGAGLLARAKARWAKMEADKAAADKKIKDIQEELKVCESSEDPSAMEGPLARDAAYGVVSDSVKAITERKANLDKQQDLRLRLQGCAV